MHACMVASVCLLPIHAGRGSGAEASPGQEVACLHVAQPVACSCYAEKRFRFNPLQEPASSTAVPPAAPRAPLASSTAVPPPMHPGPMAETPAPAPAPAATMGTGATPPPAPAATMGTPITPPPGATTMGRPWTPITPPPGATIPVQVELSRSYLTPLVESGILHGEDSRTWNALGVNRPPPVPDASALTFEALRINRPPPPKPY